MDATNKKDFARTNLVTSFICTGCGKNLTVSFDDLGKPAPDAKTSFGMSGAYNLENRVHVNPCQTCIDKETAPARALAKAVADLSALTQEKK